MDGIAEAAAGALDGLAGLSADGPLHVGLLGVALGAVGVIWVVRRQRSAQAPEASGVDETGVRRLVESGDVERAADLLVERGDHERAIPLYQQSDSRAKLARCYIELKQLAEAAEIYLQLGRHAEAAHYFQTAGRWPEAAECLLILGQVREAAELFERADNLRRAAELMRSLGDNENAARLYARAGLGAEAAGCLLAARERTPKVLLLAADYYQSAGEPLRAAECFSEAGELRRAAELFAEAGSHLEAAQAFAREQIWDRAGHCYREAEALAEARTCFERAGDRVQAAQLALERGDYFDAATALYEIGSYERALEALQSIDAKGPDGRGACRLRARIFIEKGLFDRAREQLDVLGASGGYRKQDLDTLLMLATALERTGDGMGALTALEQIQEFDPEYGDVAERVERLQERAWGGSQTLGPIDSGRYELRDEIGRGGMGIVHLAWDLELERPVAIKFLPAELASNPASVKMFRQEARAAAAMNHPNIVHVYDVAIVSDQPCIVMEYVQGRTVREVMRVRGRRDKAPLPPRRVAEISREICHALSYAHSQNVIHRDIKPGNMLIASDGRVKLMDFGISKVLETGAEGLTQAKGTPQYMPPEQILGREIDGRTDLYALGISMYEMATGQRPFGGDGIVDQQLNDPVPDPRDLRSDLPEKLVEIVLKATQKKPPERFSSAHEMAEALSTFLDGYEDTVAGL
jgi:tetratricopeptide (TPR) repeat protein